MQSGHPIREEFLPGAHFKDLVKPLQRNALRFGLEEKADDDGEKGAGAKEEVRPRGGAREEERGRESNDPVHRLFKST